MTDLYITYNIRERYWVSKLVQSLEFEGYTVWWDHAVIPGANFRNESQLALSQAKCVLAVWSETAVDDHWVLVDAEQAKQQEMLVSVLASYCTIPNSYRHLELTDLKGWDAASKQDVHFKNLLKTIQAYTLPSQPPQSEKQQQEDARLKRMRKEAERKQQQRESRESQMIRKRSAV